MYCFHAAMAVERGMQEPPLPGLYTIYRQ
jgi:hypothetical protein